MRRHLVLVVALMAVVACGHARVQSFTEVAACQNFAVRQGGVVRDPRAPVCELVRQALDVLREWTLSNTGQPLDPAELDTVVTVRFTNGRAWPGGPETDTLGVLRIALVDFVLRGASHNPTVAIDRADGSAFLGWVHR